MLFLIIRNKVPQGAKVKYCCIICNIRPQNKETKGVQIPVGGYKLTFDGPVSTPASDIITLKIYWDSLLSTPGSKNLVANVKNFYLNNLMSKNEFYKIPIRLITPEITNK